MHVRIAAILSAGVHASHLNLIRAPADLWFKFNLGNESCGLMRRYRLLPPGDSDQVSLSLGVAWPHGLAFPRAVPAAAASIWSAGRRRIRERGKKKNVVQMVR